MKKSILFVAGMITVSLFAQQNLIYQNVSSGGFKLVDGAEEYSIITYKTEDVVQKLINTPNGLESVISVEDGTPILEAGAPDLPKVNTSIIIPDMDRMKIHVLYSEFTDYPNVNVAPSKGTLVRDVNPDDVPFNYGDVYSTDDFWPGQIAELREPYILRDYRAQSVVINPIQYNPVTKTLRVYTYIKLKVYIADEYGENQLVRNPNASSIEKEFNDIYSTQFLNYDVTSRYTTVEDNGSMLVICHPPYQQYMTDFVNWKIQRGMKTELVTTTTTGITSSSVKAYIQGYYSTNPDLKYVLIVGDHAHVNAAEPGGGNDIAGPSDNWYGYLTGNDHYPEIFVGRFSANTVTDVTTQVQRSIEYEKTPDVQGSFGRSTHIGSAEGPGDDNEYDYEHQRNLRAQLLAFTYTEGDEIYDGSQGGNDAPGDPGPMDVVDAVNLGRGVLLYTGHGSSYSCATSGFGTGNIPSLTNIGMLPFFWSVACVNGNFTHTTCFAEDLVRATDGGQPIGCVATLMSTINQYWNQPMEGQDEMVNLLTSITIPGTVKTFGAVSMNGCMQMNDSYGTSGADMTDTWTCFGDPSLLVRTATPQSLTADHLSSDVPGITTVNVASNVEGGFVSLTMNNTILGTGYISGGDVDITIPAATQGDQITVTITAFNYVPYIGTLNITSEAIGLEENNIEGVSVYPNPVSDIININVTQNSVDHIKIYDATGKVVYVNNNSIQGNYSIGVTDWARGVYTIELTSGNEVQTQKLILN